MVFAETDVGDAYIKPLGGCKDGPHPLACEWVGSQLARWFGLPTPDFSIMELDKMDIELIKCKNGIAELGSAFCSKAIPEAYSWGGKTLKDIANLEIISRMVVFDTWALNWDRHPPIDDKCGRKPNYDNLLLSSYNAPKNRLNIFVIDYGECFSESRTLSKKNSRIERCKSEQIYGLFPAFREFIKSEDIDPLAQKLKTVKKEEIESMVRSIPSEWEVDSRAQESLVDLIFNRADFLSNNVQAILNPF